MTTAASDYEPSPFSFAADQVALYESSGGKEGNSLQGKPVVILTTRGRRTGKTRKTPLMRVESGGRYAVIASMGGAPKHPVWYLNLVARPEVTVQDGPAPRPMRARVLSGDEKAHWWALACEAWPAYADYQEKTTREIPVVLLEPAG